jgi:hypothetical protein
MAYRRPGDRVWVRSLNDVATITGIVSKKPLIYSGEWKGDRVSIAAPVRSADRQCDECNRWLPLSSFNQGHHGEVDICFLCLRSYKGEVAGWAPHVDQQYEDERYDRADGHA